MTLDLNGIPHAGEEPPDATPTRVLTGLVAPRRRRTFLKAMAYGALSFGAAALTVPFLGRARRAQAETSPGGGLKGYDDNKCVDAYGAGGYAEAKDTHGMYMTETAACFGGTYMGWNWCTSNGWHRSGNRIPSAPPGWLWECWPISGACGKAADNMNSWRWTTDDGTPRKKMWRCSDGNSKVTRDVWWDWWHGPYLSICRARVA